MKVQLEETKHQVDGQRAEQQKLQKIIADADADVFQLKKQLEQVGKEAGGQRTKWARRLRKNPRQIIC